MAAWRGRGSALLVAFVVVQFALPGCVFTRSGVSPMNIEDGQVPPGRRTRSAVKAHLQDGSVVIFPRGFTLEDGVLRGAGERYDLTRRERKLVDDVPLDEVAALESYGAELRPVATFFGVAVGGPVITLSTFLAIYILLVSL